MILVVFWSEWGDSNSRHPAPKAGALPTALHPGMRFLARMSACQRGNTALTRGIKLKYYMTQCARSQAKPLTNRARLPCPCLIVPIIYKKKVCHDGKQRKRPWTRSRRPVQKPGLCISGQRDLRRPGPTAGITALLASSLKNNVKKAWWKKFVQESKYNVGLIPPF